MSISAPAFAGHRAFRKVAFAGSLGLVSPAASRVFQRTERTGGAFGLGSAAVPLTLTPAQPVGLLEMRLRDATTPSTVLADWTPIPGVTLGAGAAQAVSVTVPARAGWTLIDLRPNGEFGSIATTAQIGVGEVIAASGQSLASDFWGTTESGDTTTLAALGVTPSANSACLAGWDGATVPVGQNWATPADGSAYPSAFAAELLRLIVAATGVNAGLIGYAWTGQPIAQWAQTGNPGNPNVWTPLTGVLDQSPVFGTFLWCQGHNDARTPATGANGALTPAATYVSALQSLLSALAARYPGMPFARVLTSIPAMGSAADVKYPANWAEVIRGAHQTVIAADPLAREVDGLDVAVNAADGVHPTQAGNVTFARHVYRACMQSIAPARFAKGDKGPTFQGTARRAPGSAAIVLPVTQAGGTALTCPGGSPATQFQVFASGSMTGALTISSADLSNPAQITLTLSSVPSDTQALDIWYRLPYDSSAAVENGIYDNNAADGDGLTVGRQLMLTGATAAITAPSPASVAPAITLATPTGPFVVGTGTIALTGTTANDTGAVDVAIDGGAWTTLVASQTGAFAGTVPTPTAGGSHVITVRLHDAPTVTASATVTVEQVILSNVPATGAQGVILPSATVSLLGMTTGYAALRLNGADEGARVAFAGTVLPGLVPQSTGTYIVVIYDQPTGGNYVGQSPTIAVSALPVLPSLGAPSVQFDASNAASVFADPGRTTRQLTSFGPVQGLADLSGNAAHMQQPTLAKAPTLVVNRRNGLPGFQLQGSAGQFLQNLTGATWMQGLMTGPLTVLAVFEVVSDASSTTPYVPFSLAFSGNTTGSNSFNVQASTTGTPWVGAARNPVGSFGSAKDTTASITQKSLLLKVAGSFSAASSSMTTVVNADAAVSRTGISGALSQAGSLWDTAMLGGESGSPAFGFDGYLSEVVVWPVAATVAQLQSLTAYATSKWGS